MQGVSTAHTGRQRPGPRHAQTHGEKDEKRQRMETIDQSLDDGPAGAPTYSAEQQGTAK